MLSHSPARNSPDDPSLSAGHLNGEQWQPLLHLFDFLPVGIYWATPEGQIVKANSALACMLGYLDCNMLLSVNVVDLYVHVEDRQRELALLKHPGDLCVSEIQLRHHNGSALWGQSMITAVQKAEGQELYHLGLVENLTKYYQTLEALRENNRQLESRERFANHIVQSVPSSLVVMDRNLRIMSVNRNFLDKTHRDEQVTLGQNLEEVFPQVLVEYTRLDQKARDVFRTNQATEGKVAYRAPGLAKRIYYYRLIPFKKAGMVENVILLMDDITEREQLEEEVWRAERHLASVVDCANDMVISMDPAGYILTWNQAARQVSGLSSEQVRGQSILQYSIDEQRPVMAMMLQKLAQGELVQNTEVSLATYNGQNVPIAWNCAPMRDNTGGVMGIVAVGRDLTEQRQLENQLIQSAKIASLGVMAGGIAHELRNPLGIISASAQLILEHPDNNSLRNEAAQKIYTATHRASLIIENLLKFARTQEEETKEEVDLHVALEETFALLTNQMALQKVGLRTDFQPDLPHIYGNPDMLRQVFANLILNACNAMLQGGTLTITTQVTQPGKVDIRFSDTGCGIPPEYLSKIFDPFFTTMSVGKGVGLGLSISYSIVRQYQGTIEVESQVGKGATFTIRLPAIL